MICRINTNKLKKFTFPKELAFDSSGWDDVLDDYNDSRTFLIHLNKQPTQQEIVDIILKLRKLMGSDLQA